MNTQSGSPSGSGQGTGRSDALAQFRADMATLTAFAHEVGIELPYSPGFIISQEWQGHTVDLVSGAIVLGAAGERHTGPVGGGR